MAEETKKRAPLKIILKIFIALCAVCAIFLIGGYLYISSAGFIRRHVFPRIEKNLNRKISAEGISFSPFSSIKFSRMKIANPAKPGEPPLFAAEEISVRYRALSFLSDAPVIHEISAVKPEINVLVFHNGTTSLDDIIPKQPAGKPAAPKTAEKKPAEPSAPQPPADLPDFSLENFDMRG
ncbi:MAG TPA: AsmA family protein, partial [Candidatus Sumerlaeia bacterium]|nr:AsmA family protein [Candidatus Sumerlaeia bacterium]